MNNINEIKEIEKGIADATKIAHNILAMLRVKDKIPRKALISILMILQVMLDKEEEFSELHSMTTNALRAFGITREEEANGN